MNPEAKKAREIAINNLRSCYQQKGIVAGITRLKEYYARNSFFASLGAIEVEDFEIVQKNLELFLNKQQKDGRIPKKISITGKPDFGGTLFSNPLDHNALLVVAFAEFIRATNKKLFLKKHFSSLKSTMNFLEKHKKNGLLEEHLLSSWTDTIFKMGTVLYTNCCYYKALEDFSFLCGYTGQKKAQEKYAKKAGVVKDHINRVFWNGNYYSDWVDLWEHDYFSSDGNVLAVLWGIADFEQAQRIENNIRQHQLNKLPLKNVYPPYPFWRVLWFLLPFDAYHYHNGTNWTWLGAANILALKKIGWHQEARQEIKALVKSINENGNVLEVLWKEKPFSTLFLKSELHYSWAAGLVIKALSKSKQS